MRSSKLGAMASSTDCWSSQLFDRPPTKNARTSRVKPPVACGDGCGFRCFGESKTQHRDESRTSPVLMIQNVTLLMNRLHHQFSTGFGPWFGILGQLRVSKKSKKKHQPQD